MLSKNGKTQVSPEDVRPIAIMPHVFNVLEKAIQI
jgi:hypothetical protein